MQYSEKTDLLQAYFDSSELSHKTQMCGEPGNPVDDRTVFECQQNMRLIASKIKAFDKALAAKRAVKAKQTC